MQQVTIRAGMRSWVVARRVAGGAGGDQDPMSGQRAAVVLEPVLRRKAAEPGESLLLRKLEALAYGVILPAIGRADVDEKRMGRVLRALENGTLQVARNAREQAGGSRGAEEEPPAKKPAKPNSSSQARSSQTSTSSNGTSGGSSGVRPDEPGTSNGVHWVEFRYLMAGTKMPIKDAEQYTLTYPTGSKQNGLLQNGIARRDDVPTGTYIFQAPHFIGIKWAATRAIHGEPVSFQLVTKNIPDNEVVTVKIYPACQEEIVEPRDTLSIKVQSGQAWGTWEIEQLLWEAPRGLYVAVATWRSKMARSQPLLLTPHPIETAKGIQQRLKRLGLYDDFIDGILGQHSYDATRQFQAAHPPLAVDGIAGPHTQFMLKTILY